MRKLVLIAATGAGSGYSPVAPGTVGSAVGLAIWALARELSIPAYLALTAGVTLGGALVAHRAEAILGARDDGRITIDEVAGMLLSLAWLPATAPALFVGGTGFLLFRVFDVAKPPPALAAEQLPGGLGVMADDLVAAVYANACGQLLWRLLWPGLGT
jgi:phosphatidylglycerophosphatase A